MKYLVLVLMVCTIALSVGFLVHRARRTPTEAERAERNRKARQIRLRNLQGHPRHWHYVFIQR